MSARAMTLSTALLASLTLRASPARGQDHCALCHLARPELQLSWPVATQAESAHGAAEMSCADCHGGRREEPTARAHDPEADFVARPAAAEVPEICGGCHADPERLGPEAAAELPTDQLRLYRRSGHGLALKRGVSTAATCASCHGTHDVKPAAHPESKMHPDNIAPTCGGCHSDDEAMTDSGMPLNQMSRWRRSVHGRAFIDEEDDAAPTCSDCHDAHGGLSGLHDVQACGRCHPSQEQSFALSPHAEVFERLGFASCVDCHGAHDVRPTHAALIGVMRESTCRLCHTEEQPQVFETIRRLGELRASAEAASRRGRQALEQLSSRPEARARAREITAELEEAETALDAGIHSFNDSQVEQAVRQMTQAATRAVALERETRPAGSSDWNALLVAVAVVALVAIGATLLFVRRRA